MKVRLPPRFFKTFYWRLTIVVILIVIFVWLYRYLLSAHYSLLYTGALALKENRFTAEYLRGSYTYGVFAAALLLMIVGAGIMDLVSYVFLTKKYEEISKSILSFAGGNYSIRVNSGGLQQLEPLAGAFNRMADRMVKNIEELQATDTFRKELVANIAHDLGSPVTSIRGYAETVIMKDSVLTSAQRLRFMNTILSNADYLARLIDELVQLSRLESREITLHIEHFPLAEIVNRVVTRLKDRAEEQGHLLQIEDLEPSLTVAADKELLERLMNNLIDNAIKYTPADGTILVGAARSEGRVLVKVTDTGIGIPEEHIPLVSQRFFRAEKHRGREKGGGIGLGLAISEMIAVAHGSSLSIQSQVGKGTEISFSLSEAAPGDRKVEINK